MEDELQEEEQEAFESIFALTLAQLDLHVVDTDLLSNEVFIQSHEFYEDQITCMAMDSEVKRKEKLEGLFEDFLDEEEVREPLEDEEAYEAIELSSLVVLSYTPTADPYFPPTPPSPYYVLYMIEPKEKFSTQAHNQSKRSRVGIMNQILPNHAKIEGVHISCCMPLIMGKSCTLTSTSPNVWLKTLKQALFWEATQVS